MSKKNKLLFHIFILLFTFSCKNSKKDDPLIVPPNFCEMPDLKNPENINKKNELKDNQQDVERLKELLLQSD
jgi:hypothetical protein